MPTPTTTPAKAGSPLVKTGTAPTNNPAFQKNVEGKLLSSTKVGRFIEEDYGDHTVLVDPTGKMPPKVHSGQYATPEQKALAQAKGVRLTQQHHGTFGTQHQGADTGVYNKKDGTDFDWNDFGARHGDFLNEKFAGGLEGFKSAVQKKGPDSEKTTRWFQQTVNAELKKQGKPAYFIEDGTSLTSNHVDGKFGIQTYSVPSFYEAPKAAPLPDLGNGEKPLPNPMDPSQTQAKPGKWWQQDIVNLAAAATDKVGKYDPMLQQVNYEAPDYALLDPSRQLASIKEGQAQFQDLAMSTSEGAVARANVLGMSGESLGKAADVIGQYENQNVGIANAASSAQSQIHNQEIDTNTKYLDQFVGQMATVNQNYDNAMRDKKYRVVDALNQGTTNSQHQTQLEQMYPQVKVNRSSGQMIFSGDGKDVEFDDVEPGQTSYDPQAISDQTASLYKQSLDKGRTMGLDGDDLHKFAQHISSQAMSQATKAGVPKTNAGRARQMRGAMNGGKYSLGGQVLPEMPQIGF